MPPMPRLPRPAIETMSRSAALLLLPLLIAACDAPMSAGADYDASLDFTRFGTFAWEEAELHPTGDPRLDDNPFFDERIRAVVTAELAARGVRVVGIDDAPDLLVHYHASVRDRVEVYEVDRSAGYDVSDYGPGTEVYQYEEGTLLVDLVERESMRVIWRGWARADITRAIDDLEVMGQLLQAAAREMFSHYPAGVASPAGPAEG